MSAPSTAQVLENAARTATQRYTTREVERAVSVNGHPTRRLTPSELGDAVAILSSQGCVWSEIQMRLGANP